MNNINIVKREILNKGFVPMFIDPKLDQLNYLDIKELINGIEYEQHSFKTICGQYVVDMETWFNDNVEKDVIVYDIVEYKDMVGDDIPW